MRYEHVQPEGEYRGWEYAAALSGIKTFWRGLMRQRGKALWRELCILDDTKEEALRCALDCIDYEYRVAVFEFLEGREYDPTKDGALPANT